MNKVFFETVQVIVWSVVLFCLGLYIAGYSVIEGLKLFISGFIPGLLWLIPRQLYEAEKISLETKNAIQILGVGTVTILYAGRAMYYYRLAYRTGDPLDVVLWGMAAWLGLIFVTLIYAQLKNPKKEEENKEE